MMEHFELEIAANITYIEENDEVFSGPFWFYELILAVLFEIFTE